MTDGLPGLDLPAVEAHLAAHRPDLLDGPLSAELVAGGRSNLTYALASGDRRLVLRRAPLGHVLATAHDMSREHAVQTALAGSAVPVAATHLLCEDPDVTGAPFYVMDLVEGEVLRTLEQTAPLGERRRRLVAERMVDVLVDLHAVVPADVGLEGFGRPEGYLERQVRRWGTQLDASRSRELAGVEELRSALASSVPVTRRSGVVHGDYRLDNLVVGPDAGGEDVVRAVLDWEMSTLGDVLADLGLLLVYWRVLGAPDDPIAGGIGERAGFPAAADLASRYLGASGLDDADLLWYQAFSSFKLAVVLEGIHYRYTRGQTVGAGFAQVGRLVPELVRSGLADLGTG